MRNIAAVAAALLLSVAVVRAVSPADSESEPVAIVYVLTGAATWTTAPEQRAVRLFDRVPAGMTLDVAAESSVALAFSSGFRYSLGPEARVRLGKTDLDSQSGPVTRLRSVPPLPIVAPLAEDSRASRPAAIRVRGRNPAQLYPRDGTSSLSDATVLRFSATPGATRYTSEILDATGESVFQRETSNTAVPVPPGVLKPGTRYAWTVRAFDSNGVAETSRAQLSTLDHQTTASRADLAKAMHGTGDAASLTLLAGIDEGLGLLWEARDELQQVVRKAPQNGSVQNALTRLEGVIGSSAFEKDP